jgi:hypothetical protein
MRKCELPASYQAKFLGENARKLYHIPAPKKFIRDRVTEIQRPEWWPTDEEVKRSLDPEAAVVRRYGEGAHRGNGHAREGARS